MEKIETLEKCSLVKHLQIYVFNVNRFATKVIYNWNMNSENIRDDSEYSDEYFRAATWTICLHFRNGKAIL